MISWMKPEKGSVTGYKVLCKQDADTDEVTKEVVLKDSETLETTFNDLTKGQIYIVEIITLSGSMESEAVKLEVSTKSPIVVDATVEPNGSTATVSWKKPAAGSYTGYKLSCHIKNDPASNLEDLIVEDPDTLEGIFTGLIFGEIYVININTLCGEIEGEVVQLEFSTSELSMFKASPSQGCFWVLFVCIVHIKHQGQAPIVSTQST
ncbi:uncharacterized protein LOC117104246 [Anneissia japonica]|uniref:uncharacterized protein LOC117104246 n=1 Tax=Anneissia japonica TaxID=1529436 RepID=UPI00142585A2|nr:uncharacterized protein LOC117104246 [Anneissia japonica]